MKRLLVFILILLLSVQTFSKWLILLEYRVNQDYIAKVLCENKTKPELKCKGKCQLMKQLDAAEKQDGNKENNTAKIQFADVLFTATSNTEKLEPIACSTPQARTRYLIRPYTTPATGIFHPPLQG